MSPFHCILSCTPITISLFMEMTTLKTKYLVSVRLNTSFPTIQYFKRCTQLYFQGKPEARNRSIFWPLFENSHSSLQLHFHSSDAIAHPFIVDQWVHIYRAAQAAVTKYQTGGGLFINYFSQFLKAEKSRIKVSADLIPNEILFLGWETAVFLLCPHMVGWEAWALASLPFLERAPVLSWGPLTDGVI